VALWVLFTAELAGLFVLAVQRSVAERRGQESWVVAAFAPTLGSALEAGQARQAEHTELPLDEDRARRPLHPLAPVQPAALSSRSRGATCSEKASRKRA
jgi:hypothetical protein